MMMNKTHTEWSYSELYRKNVWQGASGVFHANIFPTRARGKPGKANERSPKNWNSYFSS